MRETIKILILDDSEEDVKILSNILFTNGYVIPPLLSINEESYTNQLKENMPDVVLSGHVLLSGINSLRALNIAKSIKPNIVFILVSSKVSEEFAFELLKEGVDAYFLKDRLLQLPQTIENIYLKYRYNEEGLKLIESNKALQEAYKIIESKNQNITQSILFAKRIQNLTLPKIDILLKNFQDAFILYKPKDIVSGDFYWFNNGAERFMVAVGDCTGHGVSGALLSMIGYNLLNEIVGDDEAVTNPTDILYELDCSIVKLLKQDTNGNGGYQDGIDMSFVSIDSENKKIYFCGCRRPLLYIVRNEKKIIIYKGEPYIVGGRDSRISKSFKTEEIDYMSGDIIYMLTDGYADQFGGDRNRKFMNDKFGEILLSIQHLNLNYQSQLLEQKLIKWQGDLEQTDDILVVGIKL